MEPYQRYQPMHYALHERNFPHSVMDGIWMWSIFVEEQDTDLNGYLVQTSENEAFIVDPPCAGPEVLDSFEPLPKLTMIVITNSNHERSAQQFKEKFRIPVYAHRQDAPLMSVAVDRVFEDSELLPGGWQVIQLEHQKTAGESALYHLERRIVILGSALIGKPFQHLSMLPDDQYASKAAFVQGLKRLLSLDVRTILLTVGDPISLNASALLEETIRSQGHE
jgi:glyoxylase-like metal-dependent hydrolase (beta-lactamase superfamily II)